jgi:hypothetical protein
LIAEEKFGRWFGRLTRIVDIDDQVEACQRVFASNTRWRLCGAVTWKKARARICPYGADT